MCPKILERSFPDIRAYEISRVRLVSEAERSVIPPIAPFTPTLIDLNSSHSSVRGLARSMPFCCWMTFCSGVRVSMRRSLRRGSAGAQRLREAKGRTRIDERESRGIRVA